MIFQIHSTNDALGLILTHAPGRMCQWCTAVVFNVWAKSTPRGRFHALWGRFCDLRGLGADFIF